MKKRIWEIDFVRGILIILVIFDHFFYDWGYLVLEATNFASASMPGGMVQLHKFAQWYWTFDGRIIIRNICLALFFLLSGISCSFSKNNLKRGLILEGVGIFITIVTYSIYYISNNTLDLRIVFGAISCFGSCILIYYFLTFLLGMLFKEKEKYINATILVIGLIMIFIGLKYYMTTKYWVTDLNSENIIPVFLGSVGFGADHFGLFPYLAYIILGGFIGKTVYKNKQSLLPQFENNKGLLKVGKIGQYTLWIYIFHQGIVAPIVILIVLIGGASLAL